MKSICTALSVLALGLAGASPALADIVNVTSAQRWPWNAKVDIDFEVTGADVVDVKVLATWKGQSESVELTKDALSGDLYGVAPGAGHIVWDPARSGHGATRLENFVATVVVDADARNYLILDLRDGSVDWSSGEKAEAWGKSDAQYVQTKMVFRHCPKGTFTMGASEAEATRFDAEIWQKSRQVTLTEDFYMAVHPMTGGQHHCITSVVAGVASEEIAFGAVNNCDTPYTTTFDKFRGGDGTANADVAKKDSIIGQLRTIADAHLPSDWVIDLPTSAQWERACKATTPDEQFWSVGGDLTTDGATLTNLVCQIATWKYNYSSHGSYYFSLGRHTPNAWGLYDMIGCRTEWVLDWLDKETQQGDATNPRMTYTGNWARVCRGGRGDHGSFRNMMRWWGEGANPGSATYYAARLCIHTKNRYNR